MWDNKDQKGWGSKLGLENTARGVADAFPAIFFTGPNAPSGFANTNGEKNVGSQFNWTFQLSQGLSWIRGKHEFKFGWDFRRLRTFSDPLDLAGSQGSGGFEQRQIKQQIGRKAAELIFNSDSIAFDVGATTLDAACALWSRLPAILRRASRTPSTVLSCTTFLTANSSRWGSIWAFGYSPILTDTL